MLKSILPGFCLNFFFPDGIENSEAETQTQKIKKKVEEFKQEIAKMMIKKILHYYKNDMRESADVITEDHFKEEREFNENDYVLENTNNTIACKLMCHAEQVFIKIAKTE